MRRFSSGTKMAPRLRLWVLEADGSIVNPASGRVLDVGGQENGAKIQLLDKSGSASQLWTFLADGNIVNRATGMALDSAGNHTNGTIIQYRDHNRSPAQLWHLEPFL